MKKPVFAVAILIVGVATTASGQVKSVAAASKPATESAVPASNPPLISRARVLRTDTSEEKASTEATEPSAVLNNHSEAARLRRTGGSLPADPKKATTPVPPSVSPQTPSNLFSTLTPVSMVSTQIYRVGPNDVLDVQIAGNRQNESTLFTVGEQGFLEYPLAGEPISVVGLTTAEIAGRLRQRIKILDNPMVNVVVRDYASHAVTVTGFVAAPGRKILRREAIPLYAMLAESLVLPEAGRATITRQGRSPMELDLNDANHAATLIVAGDVIRVSGASQGPKEYFFIGGAIGSPGQKSFHDGLTLTQALLASGGVTLKGDARIRISRVGPNGRLVNSDHNLKKIQTGKVADPVLEKGDRIEVMSGN
ncbi:MAG TPA: polysaccharide biosynthesis/export family protein [Pyrinomonadaceae bacterium]|nr:polysaccharide biosynthesis/export family protein [Pyrinomonadaceae bacterium]